MEETQGHRKQLRDEFRLKRLHSDISNVSRGVITRHTHWKTLWIFLFYHFMIKSAAEHIVPRTRSKRLHAKLA